MSAGAAPEASNTTGAAAVRVGKHKHRAARANIVRFNMWDLLSVSSSLNGSVEFTSAFRTVDLDRWVVRESGPEPGNGRRRHPLIGESALGSRPPVGGTPPVRLGKSGIG